MKVFGGLADSITLTNVLGFCAAKYSARPSLSYVLIRKSAHRDQRVGMVCANISVAGGMSYSIQYNLDGAPHLDTYVGTNMPLPLPDALQEFKFFRRILFRNNWLGK